MKKSFYPIKYRKINEIKAPKAIITIRKTEPNEFELFMFSSSFIEFIIKEKDTKNPMNEINVRTKKQANLSSFSQIYESGRQAIFFSQITS